jgi:hypothetical protein
MAERTDTQGTHEAFTAVVRKAAVARATARAPSTRARPHGCWPPGWSTASAPGPTGASAATGMEGRRRRPRGGRGGGHRRGVTRAGGRHDDSRDGPRARRHGRRPRQGVEAGLLAQARGDHDTAESRYIQALQIEERLGNQAGMATICYRLGLRWALAAGQLYVLSALAPEIRTEVARLIAAWSTAGRRSWRPSRRSRWPPPPRRTPPASAYGAASPGAPGRARASGCGCASARRSRSTPGEPATTSRRPATCASALSGQEAQRQEGAA